MPITSHDVQHMATLARLDISTQTQELFAGQFADILNYMNVLEQVDTTDVEPMYSPSKHQSVLREDIAKPSPERSQTLTNAPQTDGQYFIVPRIV